MDPYAPLRPIMARCQSTWNEKDFHSAVNVTFHKYESLNYDKAHQDMWQSLPRQFELLSQDLLSAAGSSLPDTLSVLDIGCGTGLAPTCLLGTPLGRRVSHVTLLDSSTSMLNLAKARASSWQIPFETFEGLLDQLPANRKFDLIITSSVLHHVPDLAAFFDALASKQEPGTFFLHVQDPNGDALNDSILQSRQASLAVPPSSSLLSRIHPKRILNRLLREFSGDQEENYDALAVADLVKQGVTPLPLTISELYQITDIHVNNGEGISIARLSRQMSGSYKLVNHRTYGFFGVLESDLGDEHAATEKNAIAAGDKNGFFLGAVWQRC
jgi:2-polyprenyl-3-methyl-5-hydroxy-6-metoxy-1,4-benzoquinol methylase